MPVVGVGNPPVPVALGDVVGVGERVGKAVGEGVKSAGVCVCAGVVVAVGRAGVALPPASPPTVSVGVLLPHPPLGVREGLGVEEGLGEEEGEGREEKDMSGDGEGEPLLPPDRVPASAAVRVGVGAAEAVPLPSSPGVPLPVAV